MFRIFMGNGLNWTKILTYLLNEEVMVEVRSTAEIGVYEYVVHNPHHLTENETFRI